jgi:hypothetical protein
MGFVTFQEYLQMREGLWLADKNAVPGMGRINPFPATQSRLKTMLAKPMLAKPMQTPKLPKPTFKRVPTTPLVSGRY